MSKTYSRPKDEGIVSDSREYPPRPICGVGAIIKQGQCVLLTRRGKPPRSGEWSIPGGAVELGETLREATRREIREECGIEIEIERVADAVDIIQKDADGRIQYHYVLVDFVATYVSGEPIPTSDITEAIWVAADELDKYPMNVQTRAVINKALA